MSGLEILTRGGAMIQKELDARHAALIANRNQATEAAAKVVQAHVKKALPRDRKSSVPGYLRKHVRVYAVAEGVAKVKMTGHLAHLVYGSTKEHAIVPDELGAQKAFHRAQRIGRARVRMAGPAIEKPKRAVVVNGHPYARAVHPSHAGAPNPLPVLKAEAAPEARAAAFEVLRHG